MGSTCPAKCDYCRKLFGVIRRCRGRFQLSYAVSQSIVQLVVCWCVRHRDSHVGFWWCVWMFGFHSEEVAFQSIWFTIMKNGLFTNKLSYVRVNCDMKYAWGRDMSMYTRTHVQTERTNALAVRLSDCSTFVSDLHLNPNRMTWVSYESWL